MISSLLNNFKLYLILIVISVMLLIVDSSGIFNGLKGAIQFVTAPIQYGLYRTSLGVTNQFEFILLTRKTLKEKKALEGQMAVVLSENAQLRRKLAETEGFMQQQSTLSPQEFNMVAARPLGISRYLFIDKGSDQGIKPNQTVVFKDNYIGKIRSVSAKKAEVMLLTDPDSKISAYVANKDGKAKGVLQGEFGSQELLDKILHQEPIAAEDLVYTDGTEIEIPKGLILGQVQEVLNRDNEVFKQAKIRPVFDPASLDIVFVITN